MTGLFYDEHCAVSGAPLRPGQGASMTIAEAEAWRAGWRAAIEAVMRALDDGVSAPLVDGFALDCIRALPMPDPRPEPSGWSYRG